MNIKVRMLVVEDHPLMAQATRSLLEESEQIEVVGIAADGEGALRMVENLKPDIVLLDFNLPDLCGDEVAKRVKAGFPHIHIVVFSGFDLADLYNQLIELKVSGIISKEARGEVILDLIHSVARGHTVVPLQIFHKMRLTSGSRSAEELLTEDEKIMMEMVAKGFTNERIAEEIHMSKRSVDNYLRKIYLKYGVKSRAQAVSKFLETP